MAKFNLGWQAQIDMWADAVKICDAKKVQLDRDREDAYDRLQQVEAQIISKVSGWETAVLSGLVPEGQNKYAPPAVEEQGKPTPVKQPGGDAKTQHAISSLASQTPLGEVEVEPQPLQPPAPLLTPGEE